MRRYATGAEADLLFALPDVLLDRTLTLLDMGDLAHLRALSEAWRRRITALPCFIKAHVLALVSLPYIVQHLADGDDAYAQLAKARLVSKAWFDAVSATETVKLLYAGLNAHESAAATMAAPLRGPVAVHAPRARMSWLQ